MNRFFKAVIVFVDPGNSPLARRLHAGYLSCVRESLRHMDDTDVVIQSCFGSCEWFSIALDTALFGQDHVLTCTARFAFKNRIVQFPLFMCVCCASTGEELAAFVFNRLKQINAPFSKLSSIATDGASNMIGQAKGMVPRFKRLVRQELGTVPSPIQHVWCLAHRLNLVIRDFENVQNIKSVFLFSD